MTTPPIPDPSDDAVKQLAEMREQTAYMDAACAYWREVRAADKEHRSPAFAMPTPSPAVARWIEEGVSVPDSEARRFFDAGGPGFRRGLGLPETPILQPAQTAPKPTIPAREMSIVGAPTSNTDVYTDKQLLMGLAVIAVIVTVLFIGFAGIRSFLGFLGAVLILGFGLMVLSARGTSAGPKGPKSKVLRVVPGVTCPSCGSEAATRISLANKGTSIAAFGIFALGHVSKTFKCQKCGYKW